MKNEFDIELGTWLREKRLCKGLTLQEAADRIGVTRTAVHCWETGKRSLYVSTLLRYCDAIDADFNEYIKQWKKRP